MNPKHPCGALAVWCVVFVGLTPFLRAQETAATTHKGVPQDWSQKHVVFTRQGLLSHPEILTSEPRVFHQAMQRWQIPNSDVYRAFAPAKPSANTVQHRDWNITPFGGRLDFNMFPAKFSFDPGAPPDCTNDFVVFGLNLADTVGLAGGHGNLVALNNLYSGTGPALCGSAPTVMFSYNTTTVTGGKIITSPILSVDGKKIAFVESVAGTSATFHVLTWTAGDGTLTASVLPSAMTSLTYSPAKTDTTSSPWMDYVNDAVYVGSDTGSVYKITPVFGPGTPAVAPGWPVIVSANLQLTSPVLDSQLGALLVGSSNGNLYKIDTTTRAVSTRSVGSGTTSGIVAPPIVDITNGTTFVVTANDGTSGVLEEIQTATMAVVAKARIGLASKSGTAIHLYEPAFSNNYFNDPSTGTVHICGTGPADITPYQWAFGFTGTLMQTTALVSQQLVNSTSARCTGWTEFFNPTLATDFFFFGLSQDCTGIGATLGCVAETTESNTTPVFVTVNGGPSGIVIDNYSSQPQASSIYFTAEKVNTVYKFTQQGLQ